MYFYFFFFFSSRRRHTRWPRDWSSDVCSSDLDETEFVIETKTGDLLRNDGEGLTDKQHICGKCRIGSSFVILSRNMRLMTSRSEERRVGKECRSKLSPYDEKKKKHIDKIQISE